MPWLFLTGQYETDPPAHTAAHNNIVSRAQPLKDSGSVLHPVAKLHRLQTSRRVTNTGGVIPPDINTL